jgi:hypothetical protein
MDALTQAQHKAAANLYQQASAAGGSAGAGGDGGSAGRSAGTGPAPDTKGDVIDAEVVDDKS